MNVKFLKLALLVVTSSVVAAPAPAPAPAPKPLMSPVMMVVVGGAVLGGGYWYYKHCKGSDSQKTEPKKQS